MSINDNRTTELRKMLEADALELYDNISRYGGKSTFTEQDLIYLLDRQAAITERECLERAAKTVELEPDSRGILTAEQVRKVLLHHMPPREYYSVEQTDAWQAIADELNAELVSRTCRLDETASYSNANEVIHLLECSECGRTCEHVNGSYPRCPHCGRQVRE